MLIEKICPKCEGDGEDKYEDCECRLCGGLGVIPTEIGEEVLSLIWRFDRLLKRKAARPEQE